MKTIFNNYSIRFSHFPAVFIRAAGSDAFEFRVVNALTAESEVQRVKPSEGETRNN